MTHDDIPIPGVDYCPQARAAAGSGQSMPAAHLDTCPVCLRRSRIAQAAEAGQPPLDHVAAHRLLRPMATPFADAGDPLNEPDARSFYAHLAVCRECEANFACEVEAAIALRVAPALEPLLVDALPATAVVQWGRSPGTAVQRVGPLVVTVSEGIATTDNGKRKMVILTLRRRRGAGGAGQVVARLYAGHGERSPSELAEEFVLPADQDVAVRVLPAGSFRCGQAEIVAYPAR